MIRVVCQADNFWADMQKQVDWYREKAGPKVAEGYVNAVEATFQTLARNPVLDARASHTGGNWPASALGAWSVPTTAI